MEAQIHLGDTAAGTGATGPGGRSVSLPVAELVRSVGLIAGADAPDTASTVVDALTNDGNAVLVIDADGTFSASTPVDAGSGQPGRRPDGEDVNDVTRTVYRGDQPVVVDGQRTDRSTLAALTRAALQHSATDDRPAVVVFSGLATLVPDDDRPDDLGRAVRQLVSRGPDRGLGVCGVAARPADADARVREARSWSVWHRLTRTADTSVVRRELGGERAQAVRDLPADEAFLETDWTAAVERVSVRSPGQGQTDGDGRGDARAAGDGGTVHPARNPGDFDRLADRIDDLAATVETRLDPNRLAADIADALEPRLAADAVEQSETNGSLESDGSTTDVDDAALTNGSFESGGSTTDDESADTGGFAGFDLLDDGGTDEPASDSTDDSSDGAGFAALAGVGDDGSDATEPAQDETGGRAVGDGGFDVEGVSAEVAAFEGGAAGVETGAERSGGTPAVVVDLESTFEALDDPAMAMLEYYRAEGPARPEAAHSAATAHASRVPAYTCNRQLRRAGLVEHVGRGRYDYSLPARVEAGLPDRDEETVAVYVRDLEDTYLD